MKGNVVIIQKFHYSQKYYWEDQKQSEYQFDFRTERGIDVGLLSN